MAGHPEEKTKNSHAAALSKLGAAKGGLARKEVLTANERKDIARRAAAARWKKEVEEYRVETSPTLSKSSPTETDEDVMPYSMFQGTLQVGETEMVVHVLNDGRRVIAQREMVRALTPNVDSGGLNRYIDGLPGEIGRPDLARNFIRFRVPGTQFISHGYQATFLVDICSAYLEARERKLLKTNQKHLAKRAEIVLRACAKVGIEALIDEATGYDKFKEKREYQLKLQAFIAEDMQEWVKTFPDEFWVELARLEGVRYSPRFRPIRWGKYVMAFVYDAIDKDVANKLRQINKEPEKGHNHHQWLAAFGRDRLYRQLGSVITIMKLCTDMDDFREKFAHVFKKQALQEKFKFDL